VKLSKKTIKEYSTDCEVVSTKDMSSRSLKMIKKMTNKNPIKVPIRQKGMTARGRRLCCHANVESLVRNYGGERVTGYHVASCPDQTNLMPHSVWRTPEGKLVDVTKRTVEQNEENPSQDKSVCYFIIITDDSRTIVPQVVIPMTTNRSMKGQILVEKIGKSHNGMEELDLMTFDKTPKVVKFVRKVDDICDYYQVDVDKYDWFKKSA